MPCYAVLQHESPRGVHWDLLLEMGGTLKTWALEQPPEAGKEIPCELLPDHRLIYLEYEGPLSGERGLVTRWDQGTYEILRQDDAEWVVEFAGEKLRGRATLTRSAEEPGKWRMTKHE